MNEADEPRTTRKREPKRRRKEKRARRDERQRPERRGSRVHDIPRWPAVVLIPALLIAAALAGDGTERATEASDAVADARTFGPTIASSESLGSFWFCAGGTGVEGGFADHSVVIVNTTAEERLVDIWLYGSRPADGERPEPKRLTTTAKPFARTEQRLGAVLAAEYVSATVEVDGGGVFVEHRISGPQGSDRAPCSSVASNRWTVPFGATDTTAAEAKAREVLVFFNPYPADAVIEATFSTEAGERGTPDAFKGLVVPGRGVVAVDLAAASVTVSNEVTAQITARAGRVVVDRIQVYAEPAANRVGVALSAGAPAAAPSWVFPVGAISPSRREVLVVANNGTLPSEVDVEVRPTSGDAGAELFAITVQPGRHVTLDLAEELAAEGRLQELAQEGVSYTVVVRTADGTDVTVERAVWETPGVPGGGVSSSVGTAVAGLRLAADMTGAEAGSALVVFNPSTETVARVGVTIVGGGQERAPTGPSTFDIGPGESRSIPVEQLGTGDVVAVLTSNAPIVAERDLVEGTERSLALAIPDATSVSMLDLELFTDLGG